MLEYSNKWVVEHACSQRRYGIKRCKFVSERSTCALVCQTENKRGCVYTCGCGVTHSCTAGHAFSAGSCCTVSRWHSWKKHLAPKNARCWFSCRTLCLSLWPLAPSPSLFAALFLGSYPAEEREEQTHRWGGFTCKVVCSLSPWYILHGRVWHCITVSEAGYITGFV